MGSPYLSSDETILLSTHNIVINTIPAEAILTSKRLILVDSSHPRFRPQDIPFTAIETVIIAENSGNNPVLSLTVVTKGDTRHTLGIVFSQPPRTKRAGERDSWAAKLKELSVISQEGHGAQPMDPAPPWIPGSLFPEESGEKGSGRDLSDKYRNPPLVPKRPRPEDPSRNRTIIAASAIAILVIAIVCGLVFFAPGLIAQPIVHVPPPTTPVATSLPTPVPTKLPPAAVTLQPAPTTGIPPVPTPVQRVVPQTGVWVQINYSGNFSGSVGTAGAMMEVAGSGEMYYQVPTVDGVVEATIQKLDNSGNVLTVEVYNNGNLIKSGTTRTPEGEVDIHADLKAAQSVAANQTTGM
jgi:hypothetical protein